MVKKTVKKAKEIIGVIKSDKDVIAPIGPEETAFAAKKEAEDKAGR